MTRLSQTTLHVSILSGSDSSYDEDSAVCSFFCSFDFLELGPGGLSASFPSFRRSLLAFRHDRHPQSRKSWQNLTRLSVSIWKDSPVPLAKVLRGFLQLMSKQHPSWQKVRNRCRRGGVLSEGILVLDTSLGVGCDTDLWRR